MSNHRSGGGRILVADDDPAILMIALRVLQAFGYETEGADDGEAAWDALRRGRFDLVITDHSMPKLSGVGLLQRMQVAHLETPVIMASAVMPTEELDRLQSGELRVRLQKPYSAKQLLGVVAGILPMGDPVADLGEAGAKVAPTPGPSSLWRRWLGVSADVAAVQHRQHGLHRD